LKRAPGKIALVIRLLVGRSGGAERLYCELANFLVEEGFEVTCAFYDEKDGEPFYPLSPNVRQLNVFHDGSELAVSWTSGALRKVFTKLTQSPLGWALNRLAWRTVHGGFTRGLQRFFRQECPDVVISFMPPANTPTLLAASKTGVKAIPTNHNVPAQDYDNPARWDPNPYDRQLRRRVLEHAAAIHVLFPKFGEWFGTELSSKIVAIPNYVSREILQAQPKVVRSKVILAVGRIAEVKNYRTLLEAWHQIAHLHPDWRVKIYGVGPQTKMLRSEIRALGLQGSFELKGHEADMAAVYADASIFCHPAFFEGFGLSVAEALALKVPVVAYADCAGVNEFVVNDVNGLMVPREVGVKGLALALSTLIEDKVLRERLGAAGPASISEFTEDAYRKRWLSLIDKVRNL
jgi:glycosyltransferase involved in cell wall biosynthesis